MRRSMRGGSIVFSLNAAHDRRRLDSGRGAYVSELQTGDQKKQARSGLGIIFFDGARLPGERVRLCTG